MNKLIVMGMTCDHCQSSVKNALESVPGVERASVNLEAGTAEIQGIADTQALIHAIEEEGYNAKPAA